MNKMIDKIREQEALVAKICELQRRLDMTERLMDDCLVILCCKDPNHKAVEYEEEDVLEIGKSLIDVCYDVARKLKDYEEKQ